MNEAFIVIVIGWLSHMKIITYTVAEIKNKQHVNFEFVFIYKIHI